MDRAMGDCLFDRRFAGDAGFRYFRGFWSWVCLNGGRDAAAGVIEGAGVGELDVVF